MNSPFFDGIEHDDDLSVLNPWDITPRRFRTAHDVDQMLDIPEEVDPELLTEVLTEHGSRVIRNAGGINKLLGEYHADGIGTLQDFFVERLSVGTKFANDIAKAIVYAATNSDIEDDGVDELDFRI